MGMVSHVSSAFSVMSPFQYKSGSLTGKQGTLVILFAVEKGCGKKGIPLG